MRISLSHTHTHIKSTTIFCSGLAHWKETFSLLKYLETRAGKVLFERRLQGYWHGASKGREGWKKEIAWLFTLAELVSSTRAIRQRDCQRSGRENTGEWDAECLHTHTVHSWEKKELSTRGTCLSPETVKAVDLCSLYLLFIFFWKIK